MGGVSAGAAQVHTGQVEVCETLADVDPAAWDALAGCRNPFLRHDFLRALETSGCVGPGTGWLPRHFLLRTADRSGLLAAAPGYLKTHSYGEYVFDWAWAHAYERAGLSYYPKLVLAVPFSPVTGPRLLLADAAPDGTGDALATAVTEAARQWQLSSAHWLFVDEQQALLLERQGLLLRTDQQFHWRNADYADFDDFLARLSSRKRKNIRRERRQVSEAGIEIEVTSGDAVDSAVLERFYPLYRGTVARRGGVAYLNREFFAEIGTRMGDAVVLVQAFHGGRLIAGSLNLRGRDALYGRYWGALERFDSLHFECCYYATIEYCIQHGLELFEAGAQGEHKLSRGLLPSTTWSAHWLARPEFRDAVADYLRHERDDVARYADVLAQHSPFRQTP